MKDPAKNSRTSRSEHRFGMAIDLDKCTGCGACMVACMSENNVPFKIDETNKLDSLTWLRVYKLSNGKPFPDADICYLPRPCMHCTGNGNHAPCVSVCPATATDTDPETGVVSQIYTRCFGCRYCMAACPYHARYFNWWDPVWPADLKQTLSPHVSPRMRGVVEKCTFCYHRYQLAKETLFYEGRDTLEEGDYQPACAEACPAGAITFGDLKNPDHAVTQLVKPDFTRGGRPKNPIAFRLLERLGTHPKVYYLSERKWVRMAGDNYTAKELANG
ncbi:MAG: molybdopterin oxidoreductase [Deltaproteobacteria bacterium]|nr:MAG: molybdopterin oxidoreductase [Deltaproteobacteria bacterium]